MDKEELENLINQNLSIRQIAKILKKSYTAIRFHLRKFSLSTKVYGQKKSRRCVHCGETRKSRFVSRGHDRVCKSICKVCHARYTIERFRKYKKQAVDYKGGKCSRCGYNKCIGSLQFHHRDPIKKDPKWTRMRTWKFENIKNEIDKCDLVCGNCHGEIHWLLRT